MIDGRNGLAASVLLGRRAAALQHVQPALFRRRWRPTAAGRVRGVGRRPAGDGRRPAVRRQSRRPGARPRRPPRPAPTLPTRAHHPRSIRWLLFGLSANILTSKTRLRWNSSPAKLVPMSFQLDQGWPKYCFASRKWPASPFLWTVLT